MNQSSNTAMTRTRPGWSQVPRASSVSPMWIEVPKHLGHLLLLSQRHLPESWIRSRATRSQIGAHMGHCYYMCQLNSLCHNASLKLNKHFKACICLSGRELRVPICWVISQMPLKAGTVSGEESRSPNHLSQHLYFLESGQRQCRTLNSDSSMTQVS